ncbi:Maestro heat-like repeat family member 5 [Galemys pyrenaicus]|uniref:Maestro heat-like repeat family member 5 n=1 Tax=Galemys pyrenaicus TaxID=202257 RepID=A0A8J6A6V2_GALPY|nr:Maestro heat-like repeat family member 5 [Galemys pyrenaicus]
MGNTARGLGPSGCRRAESGGCRALLCLQLIRKEQWPDAGAQALLSSLGLDPAQPLAKVSAGPRAVWSCGAFTLRRSSAARTCARLGPCGTAGGSGLAAASSSSRLAGARAGPGPVRPPAPQLALFRIYGLALRECPSAGLARRHLGDLLELPHQPAEQREGIALTVGLASAAHLEEVWALLEQLGRTRFLRSAATQGQPPEADRHWKWVSSTCLLCYGQIALHIGDRLLPWVDNVACRMVYYFSCSSYVSLGRHGADHVLKTSFLSAAIMLVRALKREGAARTFRFTQVPELVQCLLREPDYLANLLRQKAILVITGLRCSSGTVPCQPAARTPPGVRGQGRPAREQLRAGLCPCSSLRPRLKPVVKSRVLQTCLWTLYTLPAPEKLKGSLPSSAVAPDVMMLYQKSMQALELLLQSFMSENESMDEVCFLVQPHTLKRCSHRPPSSGGHSRNPDFWSLLRLWLAPGPASLAGGWGSAALGAPRGLPGRAEREPAAPGDQASACPAQHVEPWLLSDLSHERRRAAQSVFLLLKHVAGHLTLAVWASVWAQAGSTPREPCPVEAGFLAAAQQGAPPHRTPPRPRPASPPAVATAQAPAQADEQGPGTERRAGPWAGAGSVSAAAQGPHLHPWPRDRPAFPGRRGEQPLHSRPVPWRSSPRAPGPEPPAPSRQARASAGARALRAAASASGHAGGGGEGPGQSSSGLLAPRRGTGEREQRPGAGLGHRRALQEGTGAPGDGRARGGQRPGQVQRQTLSKAGAKCTPTAPRSPRRVRWGPVPALGMATEKRAAGWRGRAVGQAMSCPPQEAATPSALGHQIGLLTLLWQDGDKVTQSHARHSVYLLLQLLVQQKAESTLEFMHLNKMKNFEARARRESEMKLYDVVKALERNLTLAQHTQLVLTLLAALRSPAAPRCQLASHILLVIVESHGIKQEQVAETLHGLVQELPRILFKSAREAMLKALALLGAQHTRDTVEAMLSLGRPAEGQVMLLWKALATSQKLARRVVTQLYTKLKLRPPRESVQSRPAELTSLMVGSPPGRGHWGQSTEPGMAETAWPSRAGRLGWLAGREVPTARSAQALSTIYEVLYVRDYRAAVRWAFAGVLLGLLTQLHYLFELDMAGGLADYAEDALEAQPQGPCRTCLEALKGLFWVTDHWEVFACLKLQRVWEFFERPDTYTEGVALLARAMAHYDCEVKAVSGQAVIALKSAEERDNVVAILIITEFLNSQEMVQHTSLRAMDHVLGLGLAHPSPLVRAMSLKGLSSALLHPKKVGLLQKQLAVLLDSFLKARPEDLLGLMSLLGDLLRQLGHHGVSAASLRMAQHLLPLFENDQADVRAAAISLYGDILHSGSRKFQRALRGVASQALVPLLVHLMDSCPEVATRARSTFLRCAILLRWEFCKELFGKLAWGRGPGAENSVFIYMMESSFGQYPQFLMQALAYLGSPQQDLKLTAMRFIRALLQDYFASLCFCLKKSDLELLRRHLEMLGEDQDSRCHRFRRSLAECVEELAQCASR